jgi:acetyl-CoA carboxylase biotin carboxyl carrier protein
MKLVEIQELIKFVSKSGVNEVEIEQKDFKIVIKTDGPQRRRGRGAKDEQYMQQVPMAVAGVQPIPQVPVAPQIQHAPPAPAQPAAESGGSTEDDSKYIEIKSPMIGTFYRSAKPGDPSFIEIGDTVTTGKVVCIIEAMKLFNEIESEVSGKIIKVLVDDNTPVEYDQPLFLVDPA